MGTKIIIDFPYLEEKLDEEEIRKIKAFLFTPIDNRMLDHLTRNHYFNVEVTQED